MTSASEFPWRNTAVVLIVCFLIGFAVQLAFTFSDGRANLETVVQPSAVGDDAYFDVPEGLAEGTPLVMYEGQTLVAAATAPEKARSVSMMRVGKEDGGQFDIYQSGDDSDDSLRGAYFLKTAPRRFLRLRIQETTPTE